MVADILDRFQIVAKKDLFPNQLSGGQQQLVGIARAVVHAPALLLADEPTGNLHSTQAREIMELFCELNRAGTTIVQVTHSEENARYGKRIIELRDGWMTRDENLQTSTIGGRRTVKNPQVNKLTMTPGTPIRTRIVAGTAIFLLQVNMASAFQSESANSSDAEPRPGLPQRCRLRSNRFRLTRCCIPRTTRSTPIEARRFRRRVWRNSPRLNSLIRDGKLYLSLRDAIDLALENNLDIVIARYNLPIAQMDILRTKAGGVGARRNHRRCFRNTRVALASWRWGR